MKAAVALFAALALVSCSRDPNVVKKRYLENGNKYFAKGKYKEASIMYRNALQKDKRYGEAYYQYGQVELKLGHLPSAVSSFRRAVELLKQDQPEYWDANVKLADIYLTAASNEKQYQDDAEAIAKALLKKDPNSFDGHRISGELAFVRFEQARRSQNPDLARAAKPMLTNAIGEFRKADQIKPGENNVVMLLARSLTYNGQFDDAEKIYKSVIGKDKTAKLAYTELYRLYTFQNKVNEAEAILKLGFANNPKQFDFLPMLAAHYYVLKRHDDMVRVLTELKQHAKEYPDAYQMAGAFYLRLGDGDEAIKQYKEGIANDSKRAVDYQKYIIEVLIRQGKLAEAAEMTNTILKNNPNDNDARALAASFLLDKGEVQKAITELQSVVTADPRNFVARWHLGRAYVARQQWEQARQQFLESIKSQSNYIPPKISLAQLQVARGEYDAALKTVEDILKLDNNNAGARLIQSAALMGQHKVAESRQLLQTMLAANPSSPDTLFQLGVVNLADKKFKEAEDSFRKAYQLNPANSRGLMGVVETYMAQNRIDQALQVLQAEAQKSPNRMDFRLAIGNTAVRAGRYDLAISEFQNVLNSVDKSSRQAGDMWLRIGETYRRKGDLNTAVQALQKAREIEPENAAVNSTLALALDGAGRKKEAQTAYEQTLRVDPRNGVALNNLAFLLAETGGNLDQALTFAQRAKQIYPELNEISDTLGWIYLKKNLSDNAIEIFRVLVTKEPNHATYRYHLAMAFVQKGDKPQALKELKEALKANPPKDEQTKIKELMAKLG